MDELKERDIVKLHFDTIMGKTHIPSGTMGIVVQYPKESDKCLVEFDLDGKIYSNERCFWLEPMFIYKVEQPTKIFKEYELIVLNWGGLFGIPKGKVGTIVHTFPDSTNCLVEFDIENDDDRVQWVDMRFLSEYTIKH